MVRPEIHLNISQVWIFGSHLHLVPLSHVSPPSRKRRRRQLPGMQESGEDEEPAENDEFIAASDALKLVRNPAVVTLAPSEVEKIVWRRISW